MIHASTAKTIQKRGRQALIRVHPTLRYHCLPRSDNNISRSSRLKSMSKITQSFWIVCAISGISRPCSVQIFACTHFQCSVTSLKLPDDSRNEMFWAFVPTSLFDLPSSRACAPPCPYAYVNRWFTWRQQQERIDRSILMMQANSRMFFQHFSTSAFTVHITTLHLLWYPATFSRPPNSSLGFRSYPRFSLDFRTIISAIVPSYESLAYWRSVITSPRLPLRL
jgi:hypothetical protein